MLKSAVVAMTILGCDCDQKTCEYVRTADVELTDLADCQSRMRGEIARTDASYPLIVAICEDRWEPPVPGSAVTIAGAADTVPLSQPVDMPGERSFMVRVRDRYSTVVSTAKDGLDGAVELASVPAGWLRQQIASVELDW